jgi:hypothetical protein
MYATSGTDHCAISPRLGARRRARGRPLGITAFTADTGSAGLSVQTFDPPTRGRWRIAGDRWLMVHRLVEASSASRMDDPFAGSPTLDALPPGVLP